MTTRSFHFPKEILTQHVAVLGKTGSGKTSTAKFLIEQVVAEGARVCVLDPIKSDWWGLTSSADGKKAGLPFHILGGPRGHVPLHASAGKAIGEIVANGALPLSIIDMADFEPGGQAKFFTDFAPTLLRKMRGVVYLAIEEAHLFAPKERSGIGAENLSIHWAKTLATAGRSKGVRLVLVTQRTQALHNALLGSCDTMIAHRLTAPADQEPVIKWLKANTSKEILEQVTGTLASLKTGDAWLCSGEAKRFEVVHFPRIYTYDNTATPTGEGDTREIKTAAVDQDKLRAIIGDAVEQAKQDDPRELRKEITRLKGEIAKVPAAAVITPKTVEKLVLTDGDRALLEKVHGKFAAVASSLTETVSVDVDLLVDALLRGLRAFSTDYHREQCAARDEFLRIVESKSLQKLFGKLSALSPQPSAPDPRRPAVPRAVPPGRSSAATRPTETRAPRGTDGSGAAGTVTPAKQRILNALAFLHGIGVHQAQKAQVALVADTSPNGGSYNNNLSSLRTAGLIDYPSPGAVSLTDAGAAIAAVDGVPTTSEELHDALRAKLPPAKWRIVAAAIAAYPEALSKVDLAEQAQTSASGGSFNNNVSSLRTFGLIDYPRPGFVVATPILFLEN